MAKNKPKIAFLDPNIDEDVLAKAEQGKEITNDPLVKGILSAIGRQERFKQLSFSEDPNLPHRYGGLFFDKVALIPDRVLKRISIVDDLVASITTIRGQQISAFGRPLSDKYSTGFRIEPDPVKFKKMDSKKKADILEKISKCVKTLMTCGSTEGLKPNEIVTFPKFLYMSARNATVFGRFATEIVYDLNLNNQKPVFRRFDAVDAGTIYKAVPKANGLDKIRKEALERLKNLKGWDRKKLDPNKFENDEYSWVQVIEGTPVQAYTADEMYVHECFPCTDIELNGYPITPIDTAIAAITTHINITTTNKLYFQQGRSARGMVIIQSDSVDPGTVADLKQAFVANINDAGKSGRIPVLRVDTQDKVSWQSIESARDMEFPYLYDTNCRVVMAAFQISPEEIPGYMHLAKGTATQTMSESNTEYKLEAARDVGIRPLLSNIQDFLNNKVLPLLDEEVAENCTLKLYGLEVTSIEKEDTQLAEGQQIYLTYDDIMRMKEKDPIGKRYGGEYPLSSAVQIVHDKFLTVGEQREYFLGVEGASKDPRWDYVRDQFYFQQQQNILAQQQMEEQKKIAEEQARNPQPAPANPSEQAGDQKLGQKQQEGQPADNQQASGQGDPELEGNIDQVIQALSKNEVDFKRMKKKWLTHHENAVKQAMEEFKKVSEKVLAESALLASKNKKE